MKMKTLPDIIHPFWGKITDSRGEGFTSHIVFSHPFFGDKTFPVYLGHYDISHTPNYIKAHPDEYYKPIEAVLGENYDLLDEFADTYTDLTANIDSYIRQLQDGIYAIYTAHLRENNPAVESREQHDQYIKDLADIRVMPGGILELIFYYELIPAPVFNVSFKEGIMQQ